MIKVENLSMLFSTEEVQTKALNEVTFEIGKGEFVAIMGPSGCGKSTLLNILGTLDTPTSGSYLFEGKRVDKMNENQLTALRKGSIGFIFQSFNLIDELTVYENIELPLVYLNIKPAERNRRVKEVLEKVNMLHRANHLPQQLSGGQQQRVAIARAVVTNARLLLADEPTGNLDSTNGVEVMELLSTLNRQGTTIIIVTHSQRDAAYAHRIIRLLDGKIIAENRNRPMESDTKTEIWLDPDTYEYGISADVYSYIPREDIKVLLGNLIEYFTDEESAKDVREGLDTEFDSQVTTDGVCNSYVRISYFNDGWPQEVVSQENISLGDRQKLTQKYITWDYRSVGHAE